MEKLLLRRNLVTVPVTFRRELRNYSYFSYSYHYTDLVLVTWFQLQYRRYTPSLLSIDDVLIAEDKCAPEDSQTVWKEGRLFYSKVESHLRLRLNELFIN